MLYSSSLHCFISHFRVNAPFLTSYVLSDKRNDRIVVSIYNWLTASAKSDCIFFYLGIETDKLKSKNRSKK